MLKKKFNVFLLLLFFISLDTYAEVIEWYKETEKVKSKLNKKQFITLTYPQITNDLESKRTSKIKKNLINQIL